MSTQSRSRLFTTTVQHQPLSILFLIENSVATSRLWPDLKDQYLTKLLHSVIATNPAAPHIAVSYLESCPEEGHSSHPFSPRQYSDPFLGLENVRFSYAPDNRISPNLIDNCIHFLESSNYQGQAMGLHLFIVASTTPSQDASGTAFANNGYSPWAMLAQKMAQANIHCHLLLNPQEDMSGLRVLFEGSLQLRGNVEEPTPFNPSDPTRVVCRLSSRPYETYGNTAVSAGGMPMQQQSDRIPPPPRRNSFPIDNFYAHDAPAAQGSDVDQSPSLVSQLQQVHGLTKKKVYGTKPPRPPFFKDEPVRDTQRLPVRDRYRGKGPAPLTMPPTLMESMASSNPGGRAMSQSRADRKSRVGQSSPIDSSRRPSMGWSRRPSAVSSPEPDILPPSMTTYADTSPGGSYISSDFSSPVTPASASDDYYAPQVGASMVPSNLSPASQGVYASIPTPDPQWSQPHQYGSGYPQVAGPSSTYFPQSVGGNQHFQGHYAHSNGSFDSFMGDVPILPSSRGSSLAPQPQPHPQPQQHMPAPPPLAPKTHHRSSSHSKKNEDDDEQFVFSKEFVAATASMFEEEVLPAYPNYPGASSGLYTNGMSTPSSLPTSQAGELYASRNRQLQPAPEAHHPHPHPHSQSQPLNLSQGIPSYTQPRAAIGQVAPPPVSQVASTSTSASTGGMYQTGYGSSTSSLTGWAG